MREQASSCPFHRFALEIDEGGGAWRRMGVLVFGVAAYASFLGAFLYAMGFINSMLVPKAINTGTPGPMPTALAINTGLLLVFVVQHTVMARPWFKHWVTRFVPKAMERSLFVLAASASLGLLFWQWRPMPTVLYEVESSALAWMIRGVSLSGGAIVVWSSFLINHFDLFGLRQSWHGFLGRVPAPLRFSLTGLYGLVRHPLMMGFLIAFWATPVMTVGHLFFAAMTSVYIAMGVWFEERDLVREHGASYLEYRRRVRAVVPLPRRAGR